MSAQPVEEFCPRCTGCGQPPTPTPITEADVTTHQMCSTCGYQVHGQSIEDAWDQLDAHCDTKHGRRFRHSTIIHQPYAHPSSMHANRHAPLTPQGGEA